MRVVNVGHSQGTGYQCLAGIFCHGKIRQLHARQHRRIVHRRHIDVAVKDFLRFLLVYGPGDDVGYQPIIGSCYATGPACVGPEDPFVSREQNKTIACSTQNHGGVTGNAVGGEHQISGRHARCIESADNASRTQLIADIADQSKRAIDDGMAAVGYVPVGTAFRQCGQTVESVQVIERAGVAGADEDATGIDPAIDRGKFSGSDISIRNESINQ